MSRGSGNGLMDQAKGMQVNLPVTIGILVVLVAGVCFALFVKPAMDSDRVKRDWTNPANAEKRGPGGPVSAGFEAAVRAAREKQDAGGAAGQPGLAPANAGMATPGGGKMGLGIGRRDRE
jgi:hypothetical protein